MALLYNRVVLVRSSAFSFYTAMQRYDQIEESRLAVSTTLLQVAWLKVQCHSKLFIGIILDNIVIVFLLFPTMVGAVIGRE
jgi:hypothetical protein